MKRATQSSLYEWSLREERGEVSNRRPPRGRPPLTKESETKGESSLSLSLHFTLSLVEWTAEISAERMRNGIEKKRERKGMEE